MYVSFKVHVYCWDHHDQWVHELDRGLHNIGISSEHKKGGTKVTVGSRYLWYVSVS